MGKERSLLDKTMRQQNGNGDPKDGGAQGLAQQQHALRQQLDDAAKSLDPKMAGKLGSAGSAMDRAQQSLSQKNLGNAGNEEKNALDALRKGADALAKEAQQARPAKAVEITIPIRWAAPRATATMASRCPARTVWRGRARFCRNCASGRGERGRPQQELDYYDRLLKEF